MTEGLAAIIAKKRAEIEGSGYAVWTYSDVAPAFPVDPRAPLVQRGAEMPITPELLASVLLLPARTVIFGASYDEATRCVLLRVTHPDITAARVIPEYHQEWSDARLTFIGWGQQS